MLYYKDTKTNFVFKSEEPRDIKDWVEITENEFNEILAKNSAKAEILKNKNYLRETDYLLFKYAEGLLNEEDYAPYREKREQARAKINELEQLFPELAKKGE